ncbi:MAG: hypothetical protein FJX99_05425 [Bacteroidetes bacterium]|nr:hypothetical protein [Bacteroidota bacterium]
MRYLLSIFILFTLYNFYGQKKYDFDVPLRAKSNEGVYEWFIEHLDDTCDSLVNELFSSIGGNTDSIQWEYPTDLSNVCHEKAWDYYSIRVYSVNNKDKLIKCYDKNISENKLPHSLFDLNYLCKDGVTTLVLVEYY